jgi:predicted PurR-regulated permease PerM
VLNYIPYIGTLVAIVLPVLFATAQFESWQMPVIIFGGLYVIQFFIGNYLEPLIAGKALLLALGAFLAGLNLSSLPICFLGVAMAVAVHAIAWLKQFGTFLLLGAVLLVGLGLAFWPRRQGDERTAKAGNREA